MECEHCHRGDYRLCMATDWRRNPDGIRFGYTPMTRPPHLWGGFGQYMGEFTTAVKYNMDITHVLLNNSELGKISKEQRAGEWPVWQTSLHNPSFSAFARLCGGHGALVKSPDQLAPALQEALAYDGPALVEIVTDADLI